MKAKHLVLALMSFIWLPAPGELVAQATWQWQNHLPQGNTLKGDCGSKTSDVFAVGDEGTLLHYGETDPSAEPPPINRIETSLNAPPTVGSSIILTFVTANATALLLDRYWVASGYQTSHYGNWQMLKDWSADPTITWTPSTADNYVVVVHAAQPWDRRNFQQAGLGIETRKNSTNPVHIDFPYSHFSRGFRGSARVTVISY